MSENRLHIAATVVVAMVVVAGVYVPSAFANEDGCGVPLCISHGAPYDEQYQAPLLHCEGSIEDCLTKLGDDTKKLKENTSRLWDRIKSSVGEGIKAASCWLFGEGCRPGGSIFMDNPTNHDLVEARNKLGELRTQRDELSAFRHDLVSRQLPETRQRAAERNQQARQQLDDAGRAATGQEAAQADEEKSGLETELGVPDGVGGDGDSGNDSDGDSDDEDDGDGNSGGGSNDDPGDLPDWDPNTGDWDGDSDDDPCGMECIGVGIAFCFDRCPNIAGPAGAADPAVAPGPPGTRFRTPQGTKQWQSLADARRYHQSAATYVASGVSYQNERQALLDVADAGIDLADIRYADGDTTQGDGLLSGAMAALDNVFSFDNLVASASEGAAYLGGFVDGLIGNSSTVNAAYAVPYARGQMLGSGLRQVAGILSDFGTELITPDEVDIALLSSGGTAALADGPLPFGDAYGLGSVGVVGWRRATAALPRLGKAAKVVARVASETARWGFWSDLPKVVHNGREYAEIGGRLYTHHAVDRMTPRAFGTAAGEFGARGRGVPPMVVEDVIANGAEVGRRIVDGATRVQRKLDRVSVVTEDGVVITVITH